MQGALRLFLAGVAAAGILWAAQGKDVARPSLTVRSVDDFEITGDGTAEAWKKATWIPLRQRPKGQLAYEARFKMLYSKSGLYFLMEGSDAELTSKMEKDFMDLWTEDVFEVFLWTDERYPVYFEYEISPLGRELPIIVPNFDGVFYGWRPWHYEGARKTKKKTSAIGGPLASGAKVKGWRAEFFFPYDLLKPLRNVPPESGTRWRANFYRVDYDADRSTSWDWARVGTSFHEYKKFGTLVFE